MVCTEHLNCLCVMSLLFFVAVVVVCSFLEGRSTGILSGKSFSECRRDPVMSWLCVMTAETLSGLKTGREANAPMKTESCSLEARKETQFGTCCRYLKLYQDTEGRKDGVYFWFLGVFRQDPLLIHPGGCFEWSCPELRICLTLCVYHLTPGKGKFLQQSCCQTQFGRERKGKGRENFLPFCYQKIPYSWDLFQTPCFHRGSLDWPRHWNTALGSQKAQTFLAQEGQGCPAQTFSLLQSSKSQGEAGGGGQAPVLGIPSVYEAFWKLMVGWAELGSPEPVP